MLSKRVSASASKCMCDSINVIPLFVLGGKLDQYIYLCWVLQVRTRTLLLACWRTGPTLSAWSWSRCSKLCTGRWVWQRCRLLVSCSDRSFVLPVFLVISLEFKATQAGVIKRIYCTIAVGFNQRTEIWNELQLRDGDCGSVSERHRVRLHPAQESNEGSTAFDLFPWRQVPVSRAVSSSTFIPPQFCQRYVAEICRM